MKENNLSKLKDETFLKSNGWYQWYHTDYWCHEKLAPNEHDETYYGVSLKEALSLQRKWDLIALGFKDEI